jgi:uncharacterized membrane protein
MSRARFDAFSDGVFAFAATLLILGITLPAFAHGPPSESELSAALLHLWPNLLAYVLSFAVIGIMWQNHHTLFRIVGRIDRLTSLLNLGLLGVTVFIPFATSVLGSYPATRPATFLYGLTLTSSAVMYNLIVAHLKQTRAFDAGVSDATIRQTVLAYRLGMATYACAMLISLLAPIISFALYLLVAAYYLIPHGADNDLEPA